MRPSGAEESDNDDEADEFNTEHVFIHEESFIAEYGFINVVIKHAPITAKNSP